MISYETRLGKINLSESYLSKLIGHEVTSCFGVVGMLLTAENRSCSADFPKQNLWIQELK